jgi:hypothetical protein
MKTSNKILLIAFGILVIAILAGLITTRSLVYSNITAGDGNIQETSRDISEFDKISVRGKYNVYYTQGEPASLSLSADANLHEFITTEVRNNELIIKSSQPIRTTTDIRIDIRSQNITQVEASASAGFFTNMPLDVAELELNANAGARMEVDGTFQRLNVIQNAGAKVILSGETDQLDISSNAGGDVDALNLRANSARIDSNAGASAKVNANEIDASANAGGSVRYSGNPAFKNINTNAGGSISKIN